jgi:microtubule-associated protein tau
LYHCSISILDLSDTACLFQIQQVKLAWNAKSKVGSLENATHKPGGGDKKIETVKLDFKEKAKPKIGSKENVKHQPGGGAVKVCSPH